MTRPRLIFAGIALLVVAGVIWLARNTYWEDESQVILPSGAAAENAYYSLEHLADALGIRTESIDLRRSLPPRDAVLYLVEILPANLPAQRVQALEGWVQAGGRLVLTNGPLAESKELQQWSGISFVPTQRVPVARPPPPPSSIPAPPTTTS